MHSFIRLGASVVLSLTITGCATWTLRDAFERKGLERASFELECPKEQLQLVVLNGDFDGLPHFGSQVGVTGCGKRAVYVLSEGQGWLLDSAGKETQASDQP